MPLSIMRAGGIAAIAAAMAACGSDTTSPSTTVAGDYSATEFVTTGASGQTNQLLAGSTLVMTLRSDGTTTGHLHVVAQNGNPALDADMAGTWSQTGNVVNFTQSADTFVRNMDFALETDGRRWMLVGDKGFSGTRIQVTLTEVLTANATHSS